MSEYVVNEPRRHREALNHNDPDGHRALWNLSRHRMSGTGWNGPDGAATQPRAHRMTHRETAA